MGSSLRFGPGAILPLCTLLTVVACGGDGPEPTTPPTTGRVTVATATTGAAFDADGYVATIDGSGPRPVGVQDTIDVMEVAPGDHAVELADVAPNCMLYSANPVDVSIVAVVARRAMLQLGLGVALGCLVWMVVVPAIIGGRGADGDLVRALEGWPRVLALTSGTVVAVGLLACLVPALRGLRIRPVEALRTDG